MKRNEDRDSIIRPDTSPQVHFEKNNAETIRLARLARTTIQVVAGCLALAFTKLSFNKLDFSPLVHDLSEVLLVKTALALYYFSWVKGLAADIDTQELLYI